MRFALFVPGSLIACAIAMYACSSSDPATVAADAGKGTSTSSSGDPAASSTSSSGAAGDDDDNASSSSSSGSGTSTTSSSGDGGGSTTSSSSSTSSSGGADAGPGIAEVEPNDTAGAAQVIPATTGTAQMKLSGKLTGATDVDFFTYTFNVSGTISGNNAMTSSNAAANVKITVTVDGVESPFPNNNALKPGKPYLFKVTGTAAADYTFTFNVVQN